MITLRAFLLEFHPLSVSRLQFIQLLFLNKKPSLLVRLFDVIGLEFVAVDLVHASKHLLDLAEYVGVSPFVELAEIGC